MNKEKNTIANIEDFREELADLINKYSFENSSDTPDYLLAGFVINSIINFNDITNMRDRKQRRINWEMLAQINEKIKELKGDFANKEVDNDV